MNRKAALEMSVQSIVTFVLTFIVLGIVIALIIGMFDTIEERIPSIVDRPTQVNPTASRPIDVQGGSVLLRRHRESSVMFGVYLLEGITRGDYVNFTTVNPTDTDVHNYPCVGFGNENAEIEFASTIYIAEVDHPAGRTVGFPATVRTSGEPGRYTCYVAAIGRDAQGQDEVFAYGSFSLQIQ